MKPKMKLIAMIDIFRERICGEQYWRVDVMPYGGKPTCAFDLSWSEAKKIVKEIVGISIVKPERMKRLGRCISVASFVIGKSEDGVRKAFRF